MPHIKVIEPQQAEGKLAEAYEELVRERGKVSNVLSIHSLLPETMKSHLDFYMSVMFSKTRLRRAEKEMIAVVVSTVNECEYCINHHAEALRHYWKEDAKVKKLISELTFDDAGERELALIRYAEKLTKTPASVSVADTEELREQGFSDEDILSVNMITGYFNFVNRMVLGLGVELNEEEMKGYKY